MNTKSKVQNIEICAVYNRKLYNVGFTILPIRYIFESLKKVTRQVLIQHRYK